MRLVAQSPDGTLMCCADDDRIKFFDGRFMKLYETGAPGAIAAACFHPYKYELRLWIDGRFLVFDLATKEFRRPDSEDSDGPMPPEAWQPPPPPPPPLAISDRESPGRAAGPRPAREARRRRRGSPPPAAGGSPSESREAGPEPKRRRPSEAQGAAEPEAGGDGGGGGDGGHGAAGSPRAAVGWPGGRTPAEFVCPITLEVMRDPVCTADGQAYERAAIERWLLRHRTSPLTGARLDTRRLVSCVPLRKLIASFLDLRQPEPQR